MSQAPPGSQDQDFAIVARLGRRQGATSGCALRFYCEDMRSSLSASTLEGGVYRGHQEVVDWWDNE